MNRYRVLLILATLLTSAVTANAQSLSATTWQTWQAASQKHGERCCESQHAPTWFVQAIGDGFAAWQRLRAMSAASAASKTACCEVEVFRPGTVKPGTTSENTHVSSAPTAAWPVQEVPTGSLMLGAGISSDNGIVGSIHVKGCPVQACSGIKDFVKFACPVQVRVLQTSTAPCCCAKACACCESCKAAKATGAARAWIGPVPPPMPMPPQAVPWPTRAAPMPMVPGTVVSLPKLPPIKIARLVTPDFEAHCEKMTYRGDTIVLEGHVMFLSKKNASPLRVEAQRIVVNMKDGSFTVDAEARPSPNVGHLRLPLTEEMLQRIQIVVPAPPTMHEQPASSFRPQFAPSRTQYEDVTPDRIIRIVPVPSYDAPRK